jgi:hypothetical protein
MEDRWAGHVTRLGEMRNAYSILDRTQGKRPPGRSKRRWEDNIRMYLREVVWKVMDWIHVAQVRDQWRAHTRVFPDWQPRARNANGTALCH